MAKNRLEVITENGALKRVTVEHLVADAAPLVERQQAIGQQLQDFRPKPAEDLHMTLFHLGKPEALWVEIQEAGSSVEFEQFFGYFLELLAKCEHVVPQPFDLPVAALSEFGSVKDPTIVLKLELPAWLKERRTAVTHALMDLVRRCGLDDPAGFMDASPNLHYQLEQHYKPHVSLGRAGADQGLASVQIDALAVKLGPSHLRNVKVNQ